MVGTMGALTAAGAKATVQGTFEYIWVVLKLWGRVDGEDKRVNK